MSSDLNSLIRRKIVRIPNLRPKVKLGQHTIRNNGNNGNNGNNRSVQFQQIKSSYYADPSTLQPFINTLKRRILVDEQVLEAKEGVYTWILKRGHFYVIPLITNQEIGSLHSNLDVLTLQEENIASLNQTTWKNLRSPDAKPVAAGEMLIVRDVSDNRVRLYINLQSGTYSEALVRCRATERGESRGLNKKEIRKVMPALKSECMSELIEESLRAISRATGPSADVRFLSCEESIQKELEVVPFLNNYDHGPCRDDEEYMESMAGRNLIRRMTVYTSPENMETFQQYFNAVPSSSSASASASASSSSSVLGKRKATRVNNKNKNKNNNKNNRANKTRKR